jgi:hypothetical protein
MTPGGAQRIDRQLDVELDGLLAGEKPAALKEAVPRAEVAGALARWRALGLAAEVVGEHGRREGEGAIVGGDAFVTVALARDAATLEEVLALQRAHVAGARSTPVREMGALMGYPECCTRAFLEQRERGDNLENERRPFRRAPSASLDARVHRVGRFRLVSHHLCAPDCAPSIAQASRMLARLSTREPARAELVARTLAKPVLFLDYERRLELEGRFEGPDAPAFIVRSFAALGDGGWLGVDGLDRIELDGGGVTLVAASGARRRVEAPMPLLTTPGQPLAAPALAALGAEPIEGARDARAAHPDGATRETPLRSASPEAPLPPRVFVGAALGGLRVLAIEPARPGHRVTLGLTSAARADGDDRAVRLELRVRPHDASTPFTLRIGGWALDVADPAALDDRARAAIRALVQALAPAPPEKPR